MSTTRARIGVLSIGQTPRPDLMTPLERMASAYQLVSRGALDTLASHDLPDPQKAKVPLLTRLRDETEVTLDESFLAPLLQDAVHRLEAEGVIATVLLCAGEFRGLWSARPLIRPFEAAAQVLKSCGVSRIGVIAPTIGQIAPARSKWNRAGFEAAVWTMPSSQVLIPWLQESMPTDLGALVFDYVGYPLDVLRRAQAVLSMPVLDLGHLAVALLEAILTKTMVETP